MTCLTGWGSNAHSHIYSSIRAGFAANAAAWQRDRQITKRNGALDWRTTLSRAVDPLVGNWRGRRECHTEPDWLLIYKLQDEEIIFERTGTNADLFE